jgi:hypothetical protein
MIGMVGTALGDGDISISSMAVGPSPESRDGHDGDLDHRVDARRRGGSAAR